MTTRIESAIQQLIAKEEETQSEIYELTRQNDDLEEQIEIKTILIESLIRERDARDIEKVIEQQQLADLKNLLDSKESELQAVVLERDARDIEKVIEQQQLAELNNQLEAAQKKGSKTSEEAKLMLLQLHQVQEELEHYFLKSRAVDQLAEAQQRQLSRAKMLMSRLLPVEAQSNSTYGESINVINPDVISQPQRSVQTDALLISYQKSLHRAAAMLQDAIRS